MDGDAIKFKLKSVLTSLSSSTCHMQSEHAAMQRAMMAMQDWRRRTLTALRHLLDLRAQLLAVMNTQQACGDEQGAQETRERLVAMHEMWVHAQQTLHATRPTMVFMCWPEARMEAPSSGAGGGDDGTCPPPPPPP